MYIDVNWETVNSIKALYTVITVPNTDITSFYLMYCYVKRWTLIPLNKTREGPSTRPYRSLVDSRCRDFIH